MPCARQSGERSERMPRGVGRERERGSASLEFLGAALLLMLPVVYLVLALGELQAASFAAEGAARHGARVAVQASDESEVRRSTATAIELVLDDFGRENDERRIGLDCGGAHCVTPGARVRVTVQLQVPLPFAPRGLGLDRVLVVPVEASAVQTVSHWRAPVEAGE